MSGDFDRLNTGDIVRIMLDDGKLQYHIVTHADGRTCESRPATVDDWNRQAQRALAPLLQQFPREVYGGKPQIYGQDWWGPNDPNAPEWVQVMQRQAKEYADAQTAAIQIMAAETKTPLSMLHLLDANASYDDVLLAYQRYAPPRPVDPNWTPPKRTWRIRFRIWRNETNRRVQQWIHDHLPEAYCDN